MSTLSRPALQARRLVRIGTTRASASIRLFCDRWLGPPSLICSTNHLVVAGLLLLTITSLASRNAESSALPMALSTDSHALRAPPSPGHLEDHSAIEGASLPVTTHALRLTIAPQPQALRLEPRIEPISYLPQPGETVAAIAERFGLQPMTLLWANVGLGGPDAVPRLTDELLIPPVDGVLHLLSASDTLESLARVYDVPAERIAAFPSNREVHWATPEPGQRVMVPGAARPLGLQRASLPADEAPLGAPVGSGGLVWPMEGMFSRGYTPAHQAIDLAAPRGTPIHAADDGYVALVEWSEVSYGWQLILDHGNGMHTRYAHLSGFLVQLGDIVPKGTPIGLCGNTGNSTGYHLHFEVMVDGIRRDPMRYLMP